MTTQPDTTEQDRLVRAVVRLDARLTTTRQDLEASEGIATALRTEAAAQRARALDYRTQLEAEQETTTQLEARVAELEQQLADATAPEPTPEPAPTTTPEEPAP